MGGAINPLRGGALYGACNRACKSYDLLASYKGGEIGGGRGGLSPPTLETGGAEPPHITTCLYYNSNSKCLYVSAK